MLTIAAIPCNMKKQIITILTAGAIALICSTCFGQQAPKHYPGYKFSLPCVVKVKGLLCSTYFLLSDTAGIRRGPHYIARDLNRGTGGIRLAERGCRPVTDKDNGKY